MAPPPQSTPSNTSSFFIDSNSFRAAQAQHARLPGPALFEEAPVLEASDAVGDVEIPLVVADDQERLARGPQLGEQLVIKELLEGGVLIGGPLVEDAGSAAPRGRRPARPAGAAAPGRGRVVENEPSRTETWAARPSDSSPSRALASIRSVRARAGRGRDGRRRRRPRRADDRPRDPRLRAVGRRAGRCPTPAGKDPRSASPGSSCRCHFPRPERRSRPVRSVRSTGPSTKPAPSCPSR